MGFYRPRRQDTRRHAVRLAALLALCFGAGACGSSARAQDPTQLKVAGVLDSIAAVHVDEGAVAGLTVAVARGSDTITLASYGLADRELGVRMTPETILEIGSITKQFTAALLLRLAERDLIELDQPLSESLPGFRTDAARITLRQLLHHTSGIRDFTDLREFPGLVAARASTDSILAVVAASEPLFPAGEAMAYSNSGYLILGAVAEAVTGLPYAELVERELFGPAGMESSHYCSGDVRVGVARGYGTSDLGLLPTEPLDHTWPHAAGSLCSTVADLVRWNQFLHGGRVLPPDSYAGLLSPGMLRDGTRLRYAGGLMLDSVAGQPAIRHGGSLPGFRSELMYFPEDSLSIAVLMNTYGPVSPFAIAEAVAEAIYEPAPQPEPPLEHPLTDYPGTYQGIGRRGDHSAVIGMLSPERLQLRVEDRAPVALRYAGGDTFTAGSIRVTFLRDPTGVFALRLDDFAQNGVLRRE